METIINTIVAFVGGGTLATLATLWVSRRKVREDVRKTSAETAEIKSKTQQSETTYYQQRVEETIAQMRVLEAEIKGLKATVETAQEKYERRVGSLHEQLDRLATELGRANTQLETANKTIGELRDEVKTGYSKIAQLKDEITKLLIDKAVTK